MAYSRITKQEAMELYAAGKNREQVANQLEISSVTVMRWYEAKIPEDWDEFRKILEEKVREQAVERLATAKSELAMKHLAMWSRIADRIAQEADFSEKHSHMRRDLALQIKRAQYEEVPDVAGGPSEFRPAELTANDVSHLANALSKVLSLSSINELAAIAEKVQAGQRTIFGEKAYFVGVDNTPTSDAAPRVFLPPESIDGTAPPISDPSPPEVAPDEASETDESTDG